METGITIGLIGVAISAIGVAVTLLLYRSKRPLYQMRVVSMDAIKHPKLSFTFDSREISNIYSVRFVFWNGGRQEIREEDIPAPSAGPSVSIPNEFEILDAEANTTTGDSSGKLVKYKDNQMFLAFNYLNHMDALAGEIYCMSPSGGNLNPQFSGAIKGCKLQRGQSHHSSIVDYVTYIVTAAILSFMTFYLGNMAFAKVISEDHLDAIILGLLTMSCFFGAYVSIFRNVLETPKNLPKKYAYFLETGVMPEK